MIKDKEIAVRKRISELINEEILLVSYNPQWPFLFQQEKKNLLALLPTEIILRIEHVGSTAIQHLSAKPIIDMLVEVSSLSSCKKRVVPLLTSRKYEYFWRPFIGDNPPYYAWFIKRDQQHLRTHHIHMVEKDSPLWDMVLFRDYLRIFPQEVKRYDDLKKRLVMNYGHDRIGYTKAKSAYIQSVTNKAKQYFG